MEGNLEEQQPQQQSQQQPQQQQVQEAQQPEQEASKDQHKEEDKAGPSEPKPVVQEPVDDDVLKVIVLLDHRCARFECVLPLQRARTLLPSIHRPSGESSRMWTGTTKSTGNLVLQRP
eukprot:1147536-Pelagomonas_calceolata.AAC.1